MHRGCAVARGPRRPRLPRVLSRMRAQCGPVCLPDVTAPRAPPWGAVACGLQPLLSELRGPWPGAPAPPELAPCPQVAGLKEQLDREVHRQRHAGLGPTFRAQK